jgi:two-component system nitrogen regulation response regulator NtrX
MAHDILIVDDETDIRTQIAGVLDDTGYKAREARNSTEALAAIAGRQPSLVILDVWLGESELDGIETLEVIRRDYPDQQVVMISGHGTVDMAVSATKKGAYDFISKPFKTDVLLHTVERALDDIQLRRENRELKKKTGAKTEDIVGTSPVMVQLRQNITRIGATDSRVLISGPGGTGKSLVARSIHKASNRAKGPFVELNCPGLSEESFAATLFGVEAARKKPRYIGRFERAHRGTLVLDEVAALTPEMQSQIVNVLHSSECFRVGGSKPVKVNVRVMAITSKDLKLEVDAGRFREDLYHRLNVVPVDVPPLQVRRKDMAALVRYLMARMAAEKNRPVRVVARDGIAAFEAYDWPGNLWELNNVLERLLLTASGEPRTAVHGDTAAAAIGQGTRQTIRWERAMEVLDHPLREAREVFEQEFLLFHVMRFGGNISRTAEFVGMDRAALHRKLKLLGVDTTSKFQRTGA